ncbi:MAG: hypothetical protein QG625_347 [Cyanobacteriota bacterium erpe_2018_sw_39hr_WHONDRS-SW48-000098_B_bin.30]|nr:hypothetical protein [Cyanobacteriota bacterium erpe_2018_sw_39hr_WHONDRS-SW48-000098_B_bin.30]
MLNHYNLALLPESKSLVTSCLTLAAANFAEQVSEYILADDVLPHITLCQFRALPDSIGALQAALKPVTLTVRFSSIYIRPGVKIHQGKYWVGLSVRADQALIDLQKQMAVCLSKFELECLTDTGNYLPHLTWARLNIDKPIALSVLPGDDLFTQSFQFVLTVGQSNELGMYSKQLWPESAANLWR